MRTTFHSCTFVLWVAGSPYNEWLAMKGEEARTVAGSGFFIFDSFLRFI